MTEGATFFSDRGGNDEHLWVIVTDPTLPDCLTVNFTTVDRRYPFDDSCLIYPEEHPFITQETWVYYAKAEIHPGPALCSALRRQVLESHQPVSKELLIRIRKGFIVSDHAKSGHQEMLVEMGLAEWE